MIPRGSALTTGQILKVDEGLISNNGQFLAVLQSDGNFCIYKFVGKSRVYLWGSAAAARHALINSRNCFAAMQADGNFICYNPISGKNYYLWYSMQLAKYQPVIGQYTAVMQDDGNFCVYKHGSPAPLFCTMPRDKIVDVAKTPPSGPTLRIINTTPLPLVATAVLSFCELKPFIPVDYPWGQEGLINIVHRESNALIREIRSDSQGKPDPASLPSTLTIDSAFVRNQKILEQSYEQFTADAARDGRGERLRVTNDTSHIVDAYWLGAKNERRLGRIEPGQSWDAPTQRGQLWAFRSVFSGETLGMTMAAPGTGEWSTDTYRLTEGFREARLAFQERPADPSAKPVFAPLRLIGERRRDTPGPDDQTFLTAVTVRQEFEKEYYNGLKNRVLRDVEIAGPLLRWSGANRILSQYYGEEAAADIRRLTIYADRMEVADRLCFPRAEVTIHARELVFTGPGCIDTTPLKYPTPAKSEYLTQDPEDLTNANAPADAEGRPTYRAADGAKGEPGGSVTLHVRRLIDDGGGNQKRFICRGGKGQAGEAGGLRAYLAKDGYPAKYGPLTPISPEDINNHFQGLGFKCEEWRWPGEVYWPRDMKVTHPAGNVINAGKAVAVKLFAYDDDVGRALLRGGLVGGPVLQSMDIMLSGDYKKVFEWGD